MTGSWTARSGRGLGVLGAALGVPAVVAPTWLADLVGLSADGAAPALLRAVGARELAAGAGLLARPRAGMIWGRVAGDAMDLGLLGWALAGHGLRRPSRTFALTAVVAAITAADVVAAVGAAGDGRVVEARAATTVNRQRQEAWDAWRDLSRLPEHFAHLEEVQVTGERSSHWVATAPFGRRVEWDAEVVEERAPELLAWRSVQGAKVPNEGSVRLRDAPGGRGTELHVTLRWELPAGRLGRAVARWAGEEPRQQLDDDLKRFKQVLETGAVVRSDGAPGGKRSRREFPQRPARPMSPDERAEVSA